MRIKLIKPAMDRAAGTAIVVNDDHAQTLIDKGYAEKFVEVRSKAVSSADTKGVDNGLAHSGRALVQS